MIKVFIFHGFEGTPNGGWRPWLMGELEKKDIYACSFPLPNPQAPVLEKWIKTIFTVVEQNKNDELILIGHSLGGTTILRYLEKYTPKNILNIVLVSTPCHETKNLKITSFLNKKFDWASITNSTKQHQLLFMVIMIHMFL